MSKDWLNAEHAALHQKLADTLRHYDDAHLTAGDAVTIMGTLLETTLTRVYDRAFIEGMNEAELDGDSNDEIEVEFEDEDEEGDDES